MKNRLSSEQVAAYRENGFLAIEGFLDADELSRWQSFTQEAVDRRLAATRGSDFAQSLNNQADPDAYYAQVFTQCRQVATTG